jgi:hypothetical protein
MGARSTYAFWTLEVALYDSAHSLELGAHVGAETNELHRVAELHLAVRVHEPLVLQLLAPAGLGIL